jgi:putative tryptophan/tyrosine transport system substrate-binding protein
MLFDQLKRRDFITLFGGAAAWPMVAHGQQPAMPVIGYLNMRHAAADQAEQAELNAFRRGLNEVGFIESRNVMIEYRWADGEIDRLPAMTVDLLRRQVAVIFAYGAPAVVAAKAHTTDIPIVFFVGEDPVKEGFVASLNRPGGNVTGVTNWQNQLYGKQLGLLREIAPKATAFAFLVNPNNPNADPDSKDATTAANGLGLVLQVLRARNGTEIESAFAAMTQQRVGGVIVGVDDFGVTFEQFVTLAARYPVPAIYRGREYPAAGGLMSYGASRIDSVRQAGGYVGRVLKGERPADLPVLQAAKFEFVINLKTAKTVGLEFPPGVLAIADEVIE